MKCLEVNKMTRRLNRKSLHMRWFLLGLAMLISASLYNLILLPLNIVTGGTSGIATITHYLYGFDPAMMVLLLSIACVIFSFMYLGIEKTTGTLVACVLYPMLIKLTSDISYYISIDTTDILLMVIIAGVISGIANGLMYKSGYSMGGLPIISQILHEKFKISISKASITMNLIIVLIGAFFFGSNNVLYAIVFLYINSIVVDKVLLGISNNKAFYIITNKEEEVKDFIFNHLKHTVTTFEVKGGFLENKRRVMLTVIPSRDYYKLTEGIKLIDEEAFFVATDAYQVEGAR